MRKNFVPKIAQVVFFVVTGVLTTSIFAAPPPITPSTFPSSARPDTTSGTMSSREQETTRRKPLSPIAAQKESASPLGPEAEKIKFKLNGIVLDGNHVYSNEQLAALYKNKLNTTISVAQLVNIVQDITNYYRNNGYILSRAVLPPQHVAGGVVHVRVLEGYIDEVKILGNNKPARVAIVKTYLEKVTQSRPLKLDVLEYYLRLSNQLPGMQVRAVLEPSKTNLAASTLDLVVDQQTFSGFVSYDNYGTLYSGPNEVSGSGWVNSIFRSGDTTKLFYLTTSRPLQLRYVDGYYMTPIYSNGLQLTLEGNQSNTQPGLNLAALQTKGLSKNYIAGLNYPIILARATDLTLNGTFNYIRAGVTTFNQKLYLDELRTLRLSATLNHADSWKGYNSYNAFVEQGLNILGATNNPNSTTISRFGGQAVFTKLDFQASRLQALGNVWSLYLLAKGQYSFNPLLSSEQFAYGGSQLGRGYDPADIIGDLGAAGSVELRMSASPSLRFLQFVQPYIFYDGGIIWNRKNIPGSNTKQSETSTGGGIRFSLIKNVSGNLMLGQPLTKQDSAEAVRGNGRRIRGFFSITVSM